MYQVDHRKPDHRRRRRRWLIVSCLLIGLTALVVVYVLHHLKSHTTISQSKPVVNKAVTDTKTKHYDEPGFGIDVPADWQPTPTPPRPYTFYRWQSKDGQVVEVYVDTIPTNFAVNRVVIVDAQADHLLLDGNASDNCSTFTKGLHAAPNQVGVPAKWQGVDFLCDQSNQLRDVVGISSAEGVNSITLHAPTIGASHKFFATYTTTSVNGEYNSFYSALQSLRVQ